MILHTKKKSRQKRGVRLIHEGGLYNVNYGIAFSLTQYRYGAS